MNNSSIISIENISKRYRIGERQPYYSLRDSISGFIRRPFSTKPSNKDFWALKDINFDVNSGDTLGIIGKNGAGKSTLLKILSRITPPTTGKITLRGRVASLLEVGTGFNPELTGRENIYLNGAILGMRRAEITRKFDEIVAFAEIDKFLDTPVKRYSSGMYVRLAFAVAAHLEPEILLVDEVLAVGDAEFQKKCLGKMSDVSNNGRTVIFVSHNMSAVSRLCKKALLLENGRCSFSGPTEEVINKYLKNQESNVKAQANLVNVKRWEDNKTNIMTSISLHKSDGALSNIFNAGEDMVIKVGYKLKKSLDAYFQLNVLNDLGERVAVVRTMPSKHFLNLKNGEGFIECTLTDVRLLTGSYTLMLEIGNNQHTEWLDCVPEAIQFKVTSERFLEGLNWTSGRSYGFIAQKSNWKVIDK